MNKRERFRSLWVPLAEREPKDNEHQLVIVYIPPNPWPWVMPAVKLRNQMHSYGATSLDGIMWMYYYEPEGCESLEEYARNRLEEYARNRNANV